ncbi:MAG: hypothetical protein R3C49_21565 [Planctomycetaceae bacterium]
MLHPERRGQQRGGRIDWRVAALDGLGLLLFFIPGVIAFAVDFHQGTIYLPQGRSGIDATRPELLAVSVPAAEMSREKLEQIASEHTGRTVALREGSYESQPLERIEHFWTWRDRLQQRWQGLQISTTVNG